MSKYWVSVKFQAIIKMTFPYEPFLKEYFIELSSLKILNVTLLLILSSSHKSYSLELVVTS